MFLCKSKESSPNVNVQHKLYFLITVHEIADLKHMHLCHFTAEYEWLAMVTAEYEWCVMVAAEYEWHVVVTA